MDVVVTEAVTTVGATIIDGIDSIV